MDTKLPKHEDQDPILCSIKLLLPSLPGTLSLLSEPITAAKE